MYLKPPAAVFSMPSTFTEPCAKPVRYFRKDSRISQLRVPDSTTLPVTFSSRLGSVVAAGEEGAAEVGAALGAAEVGSAGLGSVGLGASLVGAEEGSAVGAALGSALGSVLGSGLGAGASLVTMVAEKPSASSS
ncbi:Uncharacterised protein [Mycobacterium tuberculosis]|nr:Uncharacterised protein [Mycobacterium tuberculosis]